MKFFSTAEIGKKFSKLALDDKKGIILDQLTFGISTLESIKLLEMVNEEFKTRMEIQKKESLEIVKAISSYYKDDTIE